MSKSMVQRRFVLPFELCGRSLLCCKAGTGATVAGQAYYRGAQAALKLQKLEGAVRLCTDGLLQEPGAPELVKLQQVRAGSRT